MKRHLLMRVLLAQAALILMAAEAPPARSAGSAPDEAFQRQVFGRVIGKDKIHACYRRAYDAPHLGRHPQQNVRTMTLLVAGSAEEGADPGYTLALGVTFRKAGTHFETFGGCGSIGPSGAPAAKANVAHCSVDCDGGAIDIRLKDDKSVLVAIPDGARIWKAGSDSEDSDERKRFGTDDKLFRLDRTALTDCLSLVGDEDEKAMLRRGQ
ncbi:hypothetical protein [Labrys okinawensis]|uniref:hypothetical protein n=1 Tax=Labrys okinawensis TaxID=346911 RepID=UPI0011B26F1C|nr:hypothetical protein [Labrys okinawensis]